MGRCMIGLRRPPSFRLVRSISRPALVQVRAGCVRADPSHVVPCWGEMAGRRGAGRGGGGGRLRGSKPLHHSLHVSMVRCCCAITLAEPWRESLWKSIWVLFFRVRSIEKLLNASLPHDSTGPKAPLFLLAQLLLRTDSLSSRVRSWGCP